MALRIAEAQACNPGVAPSDIHLHAGADEAFVEGLQFAEPEPDHRDAPRLTRQASAHHVDGGPGIRRELRPALRVIDMHFLQPDHVAEKSPYLFPSVGPKPQGLQARPLLSFLVIGPHAAPPMEGAS